MTISPDDIGRAIVGGASDAVVGTDHDGVIVLWNPGAERIFGHTAAEAVGQSLDLIIPEQFRARHWEGYNRVAATGKTRYGEGEMLAVPGMRKDGTRNSIEFTIEMIIADGKVQGMVAVIRDVSKAFEQTKALRKEIAELKRPTTAEPA